MFGVQPNVLVASKQSGFKTVADLVAAAKAKPGTLTFASAGVGSPRIWRARNSASPTKIDVRHVPFREGGLTEVMAGRIDFYFIPLAAAASVLGSGKLRRLRSARPSARRCCPTCRAWRKPAIRQRSSNFWVGLSAPAKTPRDIVNKLHDATEKALQVPAVKEHWPSSASSPS